MIVHNADTTEISGIPRACRRNDPGEGDRQLLVKGKPPMPPIEHRNGCAIEERQTMEVGKRVRDFVIMAVNLSYSIHQASLLHLLPPGNALWTSRP